MKQKLFVLIVNPDINDECVSSRKHLDEMLEQGWRIVQATPIIASKQVGWGAVETYTNSIIYILEGGN